MSDPRVLDSESAGARRERGGSNVCIGIVTDIRIMCIFWLLQMHWLATQTMDASTWPRTVRETNRLFFRFCPSVGGFSNGVSRAQGGSLKTRVSQSEHATFPYVLTSFGLAVAFSSGQTVREMRYKS